ncbi:MAG: crosslink repair DNA glycosylase YcaQ family protein, partial [Myxococcota bacterium]
NDAQCVAKFAGDLRRDEIEARVEPESPVGEWLERLTRARRIIEIGLAGDRRYAAAEDAGKLRDALGVIPPAGLPDAFLVPHPQPLQEILARYARTHGPFTTAAVAERFRLSPQVVQAGLQTMVQQERLLQGEFIPGGRGEEWCDPDVLRSLKRMSLAKLRRQVEPVEAAALARFAPAWHGLIRPRAGLDALLSVVEQLQGAALAASVLETEILPARIKNYTPADLDELCVAGEIVWRGLEPVGPHDGRIALFLTDHYPVLAPPQTPLDDPNADGPTPLTHRILEALEAKGALLFSDLQRHLKAFPQDVADALWTLVWAGKISNDTLAPLRSRIRTAAASQRKNRPSGRARAFRSRRQAPAGTQGRWSLLADPL